MGECFHFTSAIVSESILPLVGGRIPPPSINTPSVISWIWPVVHPKPKKSSYTTGTSKNCRYVNTYTWKLAHPLCKMRPALIRQQGTSWSSLLLLYTPTSFWLVMFHIHSFLLLPFLAMEFVQLEFRENMRDFPLGHSLFELLDLPCNELAKLWVKWTRLDEKELYSSSILWAWLQHTPLILIAQIRSFQYLHDRYADRLQCPASSQPDTWQHQRCMKIEDMPKHVE